MDRELAVIQTFYDQGDDFVADLFEDDFNDEFWIETHPLQNDATQPPAWLQQEIEESFDN